MRYVTGVVILIAASMACSRGNDRAVLQSPTSPTAVAETTIAYVGGVSGPMDVLFPPRNESLVFRNDLEAKYANSLRRPASGVFVDKEGEVVWLQEYIRYRTNGCDHATAMARVITQIDGGAAGGVCSAPPVGVINYPPRNDVYQARRELETKYQQLGRGLSPTTVDMEGAAIWITEYLRYRTNGCSHADAEAKVFSQIDGGPVPPLCAQPCSYVLNPGGINTGSGPSNQGFEIRPADPSSEPCSWSVRSTVPWLTFDDGQFPRGGYAVFNYRIAQNNGPARTGFLDVSWLGGGGARYQVNQQEAPFAGSFALTDPFRSGGTPTDECWFRSTSTPCNLTATANLPGSGAYTHKWTATYTYGTEKVFTQESTSNVFSFSDTCGAAGSAADGPASDLTVTLTITDSLNNTISLTSGQSGQPALRVRLYGC
jgi:hypothetical protein